MKALITSLIKDRGESNDHGGNASIVTILLDFLIRRGQSMKIVFTN